MGLGVELDVGPLGLPPLGRGDGTVAHHLVEHVVASVFRAFLRLFVLEGGVEGGGGFGEGREHRRLVEGEFVGGGVEVGLRGGVDAVRLVSEVDQVQVPLEDLVLGEFLFDGYRVPHLADFAGRGLFGGLQNVDLRHRVVHQRLPNVLHRKG